MQAGKILLQTTPAHIDVAELKKKLKRAFPSVVNIHDLHVWALTPDRVISTAHLVFKNESVYLQVKEPLNKFFLDQGITRVTLQPEFNKVWQHSSPYLIGTLIKYRCPISFTQFGNLTPAPSKSCVLTCNEDNCKSRTCCNYQRVLEVVPVEDVESSAVDHHSCSSFQSTSVLASVADHSEAICAHSASFLEASTTFIYSGLENKSNDNCSSNEEADEALKPTFSEGKTTGVLSREEHSIAQKLLEV